MADDNTQNPNGGGSLEQLIRTRFDAMDRRLDAMDTRIGAIETRLDTIETRLDAIETRLDAMDARIGAIEVRLDAMDGRLDAMDARFDGVDAYLGGFDTRLTALEATVDDRLRETRPIWEKALAEISSLTATVNHRFDEVDRRLSTVEGSLGLLVEDVHAVRARQRSLERRVADLEQKPA
ncbi:MAG: hypothetical protein KF868_21975 [Acidobacteria bacterium]|nr:hypothetical protein [Acidobacteriota bacterium]